MFRSFHKTVTVSLLAILVTACSSDNRYKRQVNGNESYLDAPQLKQLVIPENFVLPAASEDFEISRPRREGQIGKQLDIRPPEQPFASIDGTKSEYRDGVAMLTARRGDFTWQQILNILNAQAVPYTSQGNERILTDYVPWIRQDEEFAQRGRYDIALTHEGNADYLLVKLVDLQNMNESDVDPIDIRRYTVMMFNDLMLQLAKNEEYVTSLQEASLAQASNKVIEVQTSTDETGIPVIILRAPFNESWAKIQPALALMGMKITKQERSKGSLSVDYSGTISDALSSSGSGNLPIQKGSYVATLGDLENRTSLQFNVKDKNKFLTAEENKIIAFVLQEALRQTSTLK